jgi:hypothetical protein
VKLINLDEFVILGQGSEWLWTMISGLVLAITFLAIYRQLRLQRDAAAIEHAREIYREWSDERDLRRRVPRSAAAGSHRGQPKNGRAL